MKKLSLILIPILLLISCGSGERTLSGSSSTNLVLDFEGSETTSPSISTLTSESLPSYITSVKCIVTDGEGGEEVANTGEVDVAGSSSVTLNLNVSNGSNRVFTVYAYDQYGYLTYQGSATADLDGSSVTLTVAMEYVYGY